MEERRRRGQTIIRETLTMSNVCSTENDARCECRDACGPRVSAVGSMLQTSALWACRLPRGLEHASHVLGRALWHALALTDASPRAPQVCSTSREDKRTGFTVPPQTTRDLLGHPRERERLGEGTSSTRGGAGGGLEDQEERGIQSHHASATSDDDDEYCSFSEANGARLHIP